MPTIVKLKRKISKASTENRKRRQRIYQSQRWQRLRKIKIASTPYCEMCYKEGRYISAEDVHHIKSFMDATNEIDENRLAYDYDNLMSVCKVCHQKIHKEMQ